MSWVNAKRLEREAMPLDAIERGRYMRGLIAGMCGKARPSSISGMHGWDAAMDGKRFAERNGLDVLEESES